MTKKTFKDAVIDAWDALIPLIVINVLWLILTALVVTAMPAFGALYYATNRIAHGEMVGIKSFFEGFKEYFWTSWKWGLFSVLVYGLSIYNIWFYGQLEGFGFVIIQSLFFSFLLMFAFMQIYMYPFLLEQEEPSLKTAIKNSFAVILRFTGRSVGLFIFLLILAGVSTLLPPLWLLLTMSVIAYFSNWQTLGVIGEIKMENIEISTDPEKTQGEKI
jgi:uncharacterized membrane protein YesL